jgi:PPOX class probable F420-dependent enzyme
MSVRLDAAEIREFLAKAHTGVLTSLRADGWPVSLPLWFATLDDKVYVRTPERSKKIARLRKDDRVSFLVETGLRWAELKAVVITGRAVFVDDPAEVARASAALDAKYRAFRGPEVALPAATQRHYAVPFATLRIDPVQAPLTWDNAKIRLRS